MILCNSCPNIHVHTFRKCFSFIWGYIFPVSTLKENKIWKELPRGVMKNVAKYTGEYLRQSFFLKGIAKLQCPATDNNCMPSWWFYENSEKPGHLLLIFLSFFYRISIAARFFGTKETESWHSVEYALLRY